MLSVAHWILFSNPPLTAEKSRKSLKNKRLRLFCVLKIARKMHLRIWLH